MNLARDLDDLAQFSDSGPGVTRLAWSVPHMQALDWFERRLQATGLAVERDAVGNIIGRWEPDGASRPAIGLGSHLDSVRNGGRFDGPLGVLGALAAVELLRERGFRPTAPVWVLGFMDEEGVRFGESMLGSRAFVGENLDQYLALADEDGLTVGQVMADLGLSPANLFRAHRVDQLRAFLELHIEQGKVLAETGADIGVVTAIVGLLQGRVTIRGESDHGGATPMTGRKDSLVAASRMITALRDWARESAETTATVGTIALSPGAYNVIPGECSFSVDLRAASPDDFLALGEHLNEVVTGIAGEEGVSAEIQRTDYIAPATLDERLLALIEEAASDEGATHTRMPSGAGHDSQVLAAHVPTAMVFVPSVNGISHSPSELTTPEHCDLGVRVLARLVELLDGEELAAPAERKAVQWG